MINYNVRTFNENLFEKKYSSYILGADVGGTNTNIVVAGVKDSKPVLLFSLDFKSKEINSIVPAINQTISYGEKKYRIYTDFACIGLAGIATTNQDIFNLTNVNWTVNKNELIKKTALNNILFINDFQAIGYGYNLLDSNNQKDLLKIRVGKKQEHNYLTKALIGAGTGLGKSILIYDKQFKIFVPILSEGGHEDFPVQNDLEKQLLNFIKETREISQPITYEEILSGRGIENIYLYLKKNWEKESSIYTKEIDKSQDKANLISKYKENDELCRETFRLFTLFYARCAKNFVLDVMATGGLYITGGIAIKNIDIFKSKVFLDEFENAYRRSELLKKIPIYIVNNYDVSLYGACLADIHYTNL